MNYDKLFDILTDYKSDEIDKNQCIILIQEEYNKKILDITNWIKSELGQETNQKLSKTMTLYRSEKIKFLNKLTKLLNNE